MRRLLLVRSDVATAFTLKMEHVTILISKRTRKWNITTMEKLWWKRKVAAITSGRSLNSATTLALVKA